MGKNKEKEKYMHECNACNDDDGDVDDKEQGINSWNYNELRNAKWF